MFTFPRQSLLYMPFAILRGRTDCLEVLFYINKTFFNEEFHIIKKPILPWLIHKPQNIKSFNKIQLKKRNFLFFSKKDIDNNLYSKIKDIMAPEVFQISYIPKKNLFFIKIKISFSKIDNIKKVLIDYYYILKHMA